MKIWTDEIYDYLGLEYPTTLPYFKEGPYQSYSSVGLVGLIRYVASKVYRDARGWWVGPITPIRWLLLNMIDREAPNTIKYSVVRELVTGYMENSLDIFGLETCLSSAGTPFCTDILAALNKNKEQPDRIEWPSLVQVMISPQYSDILDVCCDSFLSDLDLEPDHDSVLLSDNATSYTALKALDKTISGLLDLDGQDLGACWGNGLNGRNVLPGELDGRVIFIKPDGISDIAEERILETQSKVACLLKRFEG